MLKRSGFRITEKQLADLALILYLSFNLIRTAFRYLFGTSSVTTWLSIFVIYAPVVLLCIAFPKKSIKPDFICLFIFILLFFGITYLFHPEYSYYYTRDEYGIWDHVLIPYRGIYAYLFIRLVDDPVRIMQCIKKAGWIMFICFGYQLYTAAVRGYWYGVAGSDSMHRASYSVEFGYQVLIFATVFLYEALREKRLCDILGAVISITMILIGGSRGPVLFIAVLIGLYASTQILESKRKMLSLLGIALFLLTVFALYDKIFLVITAIAQQFGLSSRFLTTLAAGSITDDSGRSYIWSTAIQLIKENPFGYGAMGSRYYITDIIVAGYPHNIIIEILFDFGVFFGTAVIGYLSYKAIRLIFTKTAIEWRDIFIPCFASMCSLMVSLTFWSTPTFWTCLAIGVAYSKSEKRRARAAAEQPEL